MATKNKSRKLEETELLEKLWDFDGYFKDEFNEGDFEKMFGNINNDFPLFNSTHIEAQIVTYKAGQTEFKRESKKYSDLADGRLNQIIAMEEDLERFGKHRECMLKSLMDDEGEKGEELALRFFGELDVLKYKVKNGMTLSDEQKSTVMLALK